MESELCYRAERKVHLKLTKEKFRGIANVATCLWESGDDSRKVYGVLLDPVSFFIPLDYLKNREHTFLFCRQPNWSKLEVK